MGFVAALAVSSAIAGQRVQVEGAPVTVEMPDGWVIAPASNDSVPYLQLTLCDPSLSTANSCAMKAEMSLTQLSGEFALGSLEAVLDEARIEYGKAPGTEQLIAPRRLSVAGRDVVEDAGIGDVHYDYVGGSGESVKMMFHVLTLQEHQTLYRCVLSTAPSNYGEETRKALHQFCSSLQFTGSDSQSGQQ